MLTFEAAKRAVLQTRYARKYGIVDSCIKRNNDYGFIINLPYVDEDYYTVQIVIHDLNGAFILSANIDDFNNDYDIYKKINEFNYNNIVNLFYDTNKNQLKAEYKFLTALTESSLMKAFDFFANYLNDDSSGNLEQLFQL